MTEIQVRVVRNYTTMYIDYIELEERMEALIISTTGVLEINVGFGRDQKAGDFYLSTHDSFDRLEA